MTQAGAASQPNPGAIMQLGLGFWGSKALLSAVELGVFTALAAGPLSAAALEQKLGLHGRATRDFLDALVALGMLDRDDRAGVYANTAETALFLDRNKPSYVGGVLEMANARLYPFWGKLTAALRTGEPQAESGGDFKALYDDPERLRGFLRAMTGISMGSGRAIAAAFPWTDFHSFADVGTAQGGVAAQIALAHPHLSGVGFDLAPVRPVFEEYVAGLGLEARLRFQEGDFWQDALPRAEVIVLGHILHDWNLEQKKQLLARAFEALPAGGALIVHDAIIDDERRKNAFGLLMSLNMLVETQGGFDYTGADCRGWMREAGFKSSRLAPLAGPDVMVVAIK
ncbi:MAG: methyltransferase [Terriglobales bacterium]